MSGGFFGFRFSFFPFFKINIFVLWTILYPIHYTENVLHAIEAAFIHDIIVVAQLQIFAVDAPERI